MMKDESQNSIATQKVAQRREKFPPPLWGRDREGGNLTHIARALRKNMTVEEQKLWKVLRQKNLGYKFRRQEVIGPYVVDFVCYEKKVVVEIDGGQHLNSILDERRDNWLNGEGFRVIRVWNHEVNGNIEGVVKKIMEELDPFTIQSPPPQSSPMKGEEVVPPSRYSRMKEDEVGPPPQPSPIKGEEEGK